MKKITKTTFKSFLKKNVQNLHIMAVASFDGMTDCVEYKPRDQRVFKPASELRRDDSKSTVSNQSVFLEHTFGYYGIWLVNGGGDYFRAYEDENFTGIEVYNSCGNSIVAIPKQI